MNERDALIAWMHTRNEFDYDECAHGTYSGGPSDGEPYAMCERQADGLIRAGYRHLVELDRGVAPDGAIVGAWGFTGGKAVHIPSYQKGLEDGKAAG